MIQQAGLLKGKNCVITSGAHGMGYSIAHLFAEQGAKVAICGRSESGIVSGEALAAISPDSFFCKCDMAYPDQVDSFADEVLSRLGTVDVLVNNVGINRRDKTINVDMADFDYVHQINLRSTIQLLKKIIPNMLANEIQGSIIHISSMNALSPAPTTTSYSSSKGAIVSLSRVVASEVGKYGIRSNVICPGWVATSYIGEDIKQAVIKGHSVYELLDRYDGTSPLMAPARPSDIANHVLFLASDRSSYITGATIRSDGAAVMQAHACNFPKPENEVILKHCFYDSLLQEHGVHL